VKYWLEKGKKGFSVYKYLLRRRPDQGDLATSRVEFGGKSAPKGLSALTRPGVFDLDISCGKEPRPVSPLLPLPQRVLPCFLIIMCSSQLPLLCNAALLVIFFIQC